MSEEERRKTDRRHGDRRTEEGAHRVYILPLWVRCWHWTNALLMQEEKQLGVTLLQAHHGIGLARSGFRERHLAALIALGRAHRQH